jgi:hypothetical protein
MVREATGKTIKGNGRLALGNSGDSFPNGETRQTQARPLMELSTLFSEFHKKGTP